MVKERKRALENICGECLRVNFERVLVVKFMRGKSVKKVKERGGIYRKMERN